MIRSGWVLFRVLLFPGLFFVGCGPQDGRPSDPLFRPDLGGLGPLRVAKLEQAEALVLHATDGKSKSELAKAYGNLGMHYQAFRVDAGAVHFFALAATLEPQNFHWPYYQARSLRNLSRVDEANELFLVVHRLAPENVPTLIELGEFLRRRNALDQAKVYFDQALALDPNCVAAMVGLAQIAQMNKDHARALALANEAMKRQPEVGMIHFIAGMAWRGLGDLDKAEHHLGLHQTYSKNVAIKDDLMQAVFAIGADGRAHYKAGKEAMEAGRTDEAVAYFRDAVASEPNVVDYRLELAWALLVSGKKDEALAAYLEVLPARTGHPDILYNIGGILLEQGKPQEALTWFEKVYELEPEYFSAIRHLADIHRVAGRFPQSLDYYQKMVALKPKNPEGRLGRALMLIRLGRYGEAATALDEDVAAVPGQPALVQALIRVLTTAPEKAVRDGHRALALLKPLLAFEADVALCETAAMTYAELGRFEEAVRWQQRAIQLLEEQDEFLNGTLQDYSQNRPRRVAWPNDDPLFQVPSYGR